MALPRLVSAEAGAASAVETEPGFGGGVGSAANWSMFVVGRSDAWRRLM